MSTVTRPVSALQPGSTVARYLVSLAHARGRLSGARDFAEAHYPDSPSVARALDLAFKAAVGPTSAILDGAFAPLTQTGIANDAIQVLRGLSIYESVRARMRQIPFHKPVARQTGTGEAGGWVAEGTPPPIAEFAYDNITLAARKIRIAAIMSKDLATHGDPSGEIAVRDAVLGAIAATTDYRFLAAASTATADGPASITAAAGTAVSSTGTTAAQMTADLGAMIAAITTSGKSLVWILRPTTAARIALTLGAAVDLPRTMFGLPVILSGNSPAQITLVDLSEIIYADAGGVELSYAEAATVEMSDAPSHSALSYGSPMDAPTPSSSLVSLWQNGLVGFDCARFLNFEPARDGAVAYMTVNY
jgi:hypothetical protein